jgi:two-component system CheB/CheR fusion protein
VANLDDPALDDLLRLVLERRGVDFRDHRRETIERGVARRLEITGDGALAEYRARLERDPEELARLAESLVVPFSAFFRDPLVFRALDTAVIPVHLGRGPAAGPFRVWAAGVATGEEVWSLAMLLSARQGEAAARRCDLLATDVDGRSLAFAERGLYPAAALDDVPASFRERFFERRGDEVLVRTPLRELVSFAAHDLVGPSLAPLQAILASFEMVVLRNVLIHFDRRLQRKALERVAGVLKAGGTLVLGLDEAVPPELADRFPPHPAVNPRLGIFQHLP